MPELKSLSIPSKTRNAIFLVIFAVLAILFYYLKYQSPALITSWYQNQSFEWLNKLSALNTTAPQSLGYYLGQIEERVVGPLSQLISGLLFTAFALLFLSKANRWQFCGAVLIYLILTKLEVLLFPPYGDAIGGPFAEAIWLKSNGFNYQGLLEQPGYAMGGPKVYVFTIYPTLLGLSMLVFPNAKVFLVVNHLVVFAMAAAMVSLFREMTLRTFSATTATLVSLILLFMPLFQSQAEAINMELPCAFFALFAAYELTKGKFPQACVMTILAVLIKGIGIFSCAGVLLIGAVGWFSGKSEFRLNKKFIFGTLAVIAAMLFSLSVKYFIKDQHVSAGMVNPLVGWPSLKIFFISRLYLVAVLIIAVGWVIEKLKSNKALLPQKSELLIMLTFCTMWFLLFLNFYAVSPRYRIGVYPFLIFIVFYAFAMIVRPAFLRQMALIAVIIATLGFSYGGFEPRMYENDHVLLERSLEYRTDLKLNQLVVKRLEDKYDKYLIGAPFIMAQLTAIPELGYAKKRLEVMIYGFPSFYGGIKNFPGIGNLDIAKTVYVSVQATPIEGFAYPIGPQDRVIDQIEYGNKKVSLFMGGVAIEMMFRRTALIKLKALERRKAQ